MLFCSKTQDHSLIDLYVSLSNHRDFFLVFSGAIVISSWNGLVFYPVLLCYLGPPGEVVPHEYENRISTPSPPSSPPIKKKPSRHSVSYSRRIYPRVQSEISLSTISEEPPSYQSSHEIVVQPELVVETTTVTNTAPQQIMTQTTSSHVPNEVNICLQIFFFLTLELCFFSIYQFTLFFSLFFTEIGQHFIRLIF